MTGRNTIPHAYAKMIAKEGGLNELKKTDYDGELETSLIEAGYKHGFASLSKKTARFFLERRNGRGFERRR